MGIEDYSPISLKFICSECSRPLQAVQAVQATPHIVYMEICSACVIAKAKQAIIQNKAQVLEILGIIEDDVSEPNPV